jgi:hypothetical protein
VSAIKTLIAIMALVPCAAAGVLACAIYWHFGTLSPCGALRETVRQHDALAAILPDSIVNLDLAAQYGALTPDRCLAILRSNPTPLLSIAQGSRPQVTQLATPQAAPVIVQHSVQWATQMTAQAINECRARRLRGELTTYAASVQCSNPTMLAAFKEAHYRYMDLIQFFSAKRLELAAKIDRGELTEKQAKLETERAFASIQATERQRDGIARGQSSSMKNRTREICTSGIVRDEDGNIHPYSGCAVPRKAGR